jgi:hypothetical protein
MCANKRPSEAFACTPQLIRAANLSEFVAQRGVKDCVIASLATVTGLSYEQLAEAFDLPPLEPNRTPILPDGINSIHTYAALHKLGWTASPLMSSDYFPDGNDLPKLKTSEEIKELIQGHLAIVGYADEDPALGDHALAWIRDKAIDCNDGRVVSLQGVTIKYVDVLTPHDSAMGCR